MNILLNTLAAETTFAQKIWIVQRIRNRVAKHVGYAILNADLLRTGGVKPVRAEKLSI